MKRRENVRSNRWSDRTRALFTGQIVSRLGCYPQDQRHHSIPQRETLTVRRSWPDPKPCGNAGYSRARRSRDILTMLLPAWMFAVEKNPVEFARTEASGIRPQLAGHVGRNNPLEILIKLLIPSFTGPRSESKEYQSNLVV